MSTKRIEWIDISKGIGIILVIMGHTIALCYSYPIYSFHMPLFFLLSGMVFNIEKTPNIKSLLLLKGRSIMKPYLIMYVISLMVCLLIPSFREQLSVKQMLIEVYTANTNNIQNSSLWFLVCLFLVFVIYYVVYRLTRNLSNKVILILSIIFAISLLWIKDFLLLLANYIYIPLDRLPFKLDSALIALIFFAIGCQYNQIIKDIVSKVRLGVLIIFCLLFLLLSVLNGWSNINGLDFGRVRLAFYPIALLGIYCVMGISYLIEHASGNLAVHVRKILIFYGRNSLLIFGFQSLMIRIYIQTCNSWFGTNMILFANNPIEHQITCFLLVTFVVSPLIVEFFNFLRTKNIKIL